MRRHDDSGGGPALLAAILLASVVGGCFRSHERTAPTAPTTPAVTDAGPPPTGDAGADADAPLPRGPVEDPGPDARPSDDPEAAGWRSPPELDPDAPCCEPIGPPTDIPIRDPGGPVDIEWNGDGWGVLYSDPERTAFQELSREGALVGPLRRHDVGGLGAHLAWGGGRFGAIVVQEGPSPQDQMIGLLDRRGLLDAGWTDLSAHLWGLGPRVARVDHRDRWLVVGNLRGSVRVVEVDERARILGTAELAPRGYDRAEIVGLKSRAVAFWYHDGAVLARAVTLPVDSLSTTTVTVDHARVGDPLGQATRLRDRAVVVGDVEGVGWIGAHDPFTEAVSAAAFEWPIPPSYHDVVGLDEDGVLAVCDSHGTDAGDTLQLRLLTAEGGAVGSAVVLEDELARRGCAVGARGDTVFVAWPLAHLDVIRVQGWRVRRGG